MSAGKERSSINLNSNIMLKSRYLKDPRGYLPPDLLPPYCADTRIQASMSKRQRLQYEKKLFYAKKIIDE